MATEETIQPMGTLRLLVTGISPILMNNPASMRSTDDTKMKVKTIPTPEDEAESKVYKLADGQLYFPTEGFRLGILKKAVQGRKIMKRFASAVVAGALFLTHDRMPLFDPSVDLDAEVPNTVSPEEVAEMEARRVMDYEIDIRRVVIQSAGIRRARPRVWPWGGILEYEYDLDFINPEIVLDLQRIAGKLAGVGDYRPQKTGSFGRYSVRIVE